MHWYYVMPYYYAIISPCRYYCDSFADFHTFHWCRHYFYYWCKRYFHAKTITLHYAIIFHITDAMTFSPLCWHGRHYLRIIFIIIYALILLHFIIYITPSCRCVRRLLFDDYVTHYFIIISHYYIFLIIIIDYVIILIISQPLLLLILLLHYIRHYSSFSLRRTFIYYFITFAELLFSPHYHIFTYILRNRHYAIITWTLLLRPFRHYFPLSFTPWYYCHWHADDYWLLHWCNIIIIYYYYIIIIAPCHYFAIIIIYADIIKETLFHYCHYDFLLVLITRLLLFSLRFAINIITTLLFDAIIIITIIIISYIIIIYYNYYYYTLTLRYITYYHYCGAIAFTLLPLLSFSPLRHLLRAIIVPLFSRDAIIAISFLICAIDYYYIMLM